jgi:hypothetical protein
MAGTLLNYVETELTGEQVQVNTLVNPSLGIKDYRSQYGNDYHFYFYDNQILFWPRAIGVHQTLNGKIFVAEKEKHPQVFSKIIESAVVDFFFQLTNPDGSKAYRVFLQHHCSTYSRSF